MIVPPTNEGTARPIWERWTIDEIEDDVVRVAACRALDSRPAEALRAAVTLGENGETDAATARAVRLLARDEEVRALVRWDEEVAWHVPRLALAGFLDRREGKPGLPGVRPLREGDVFWIVIGPDQAGTVPDVGVRASTADIEESLAPFVEAGADVWDVTVAARQVVKWRSIRALERQDRGGGGG